MFGKDVEFIAEPGRFISGPTIDILVAVLSANKEIGPNGQLLSMTYAISDGFFGYLKRLVWDPWRKF